MMSWTVLSRPVRALGRSPERLARVFVLLVCASVLGITGWRVHLARERELSESRVATANLARAVAEHARAVMEVADIVVAGVVELTEADGTGTVALEQLRLHMAPRVGAVARLHELSVHGPAGEWLASSLPTAPGGSVSDRAYFAHHRDSPGRGLFVGLPVQSRTDGRWVVTASRRIDEPDGTFGGIAAARIDFDTFSTFYRSLDVGVGGSIALANTDGTLLVRTPPRPEAVGQPLTGSLFADFRRMGPVGSTQGVSRLDGVRRWNSFRAVEGYPLVAFASLSEQDILAGWWDSALVAMSAAGVVALALGVLGWRLADQVGLRHRAEAEVRQRERQYRLLADNSTDMVTLLGPDRRRTYVSPASERLLGWRPDELVGQDPRMFVHPEDEDDVSANMALLAAHEQAPPVCYRARCKDGTWAWVEAAGRRMQDGPGFVVTVRGAAARKAAEQALHHANNQLQRLVMLDGLTGIGNRRCFDLVLAKETRRAMRTGMPLALLLIDVDRFKAYNDRYGHPAGDACLQALAATIGREVHRPADLAARYGGEEFAVLLPDTDGAGALGMAERVCAAVRALGVMHDAAPGGVATVSVGVAVVWPQPPGGGDGQSAADLVRLADQALYRAKAAGRDRVCCDGEARAEADVAVLAAGT